MTRRRARGGIRRVKKAIERFVDWVSLTPPMRQPKASASATFGMTIPLEFTAAPSSNGPVYQSWRIEDIVKKVSEIMGVSNIQDGTTIRLHTVKTYGILDSASKPLALSFSSKWVHPIEDRKYKTVTVLGDIDDPPRCGVKYPSDVREACLGWDGTASTSSIFQTVKTTVPGIYVSYVECVVDISQTWPSTPACTLSSQITNEKVVTDDFHEATKTRAMLSRRGKLYVPMDINPFRQQACVSSDSPSDSHVDVNWADEDPGTHPHFVSHRDKSLRRRRPSSFQSRIPRPVGSGQSTPRP